MPTVLFIEAGVYGPGSIFGKCAQGRRYVEVKIPLSIYGAGREKTTLVGFGLEIQGRRSNGIVEIEDLTIKGGKGIGLIADRGMNVRTRGISVSLCQSYGVLAHGVDVTCNDLQVIGCGLSGVYADRNSSITLSGEGTSIVGNVTKGISRCLGLDAVSGRSKIQLVAPLTKEDISKNNGGGGNWGGKGTIEQVRSLSYDWKSDWERFLSSSQ